MRDGPIPYEYTKRLPLLHPANLAATWFGAGLMRPAPGTWGSAAALPFAWVIQSLGGFWALLAATAVVFLIGCWASQVYVTRARVEDPGAIVIDEVAGQWIVLMPVMPDPVLYLFGFFLFRFLDILKPWPAGWADRYVKGGVGVMLDDSLAALYALPVMALLQWWHPW